ncbi:helix-turn-helix domain-containing protein [Exiguobacterium sp. RIT594]|uniref:winged helix-turn-helix transcriptional regulator n=1 Tax=Exiguobacterium sp. RIT594 TaxID=2282449 RepID=UPI000DF750C9|nr:helix-turn-helix domain-containing protein [Exiguobacterium sp. RIT594]RDB32432.1 transcriptional regulator [Exiguobacterium sp. RIT594]
MNQASTTDSPLSQRTACPVTRAQTIMAGKWKIVLLWHLSTGTKRFHELEQLLPGISKGILTRQLRELEADSMINRRVYREVPPKVEYSLTEIGHSFLPILDQMAAWSSQHFPSDSES